MKCYKLLTMLALGATWAFPVACTDKFEEMEDHIPSWLNSNIYDYLQGRVYGCHEGIGKQYAVFLQ